MIFLFLVAADWIVAPSGGDFTSIQSAINVAQPGDRVLVRDGVYQEQLSFPISGTDVDNKIEVLADAGQSPILDGTPFSSGNMVLIQNRSYITVSGFEIRNLLNINDGSGVRILGSGSNIEISNNVIHDITGTHAMGITVYGTESTAISNLNILNNEIYDCEPAQSEALTLNGNIDGFLVEGNTVRDVNNIAIDFIGGETDINPDQSLVARNGICRGNTVIRSNANYGGGYAGGIYVDGGRNIIIEGNIVTESDLGIEIGAENTGLVTRNITVRNNWVYRNEKVGIVFGGYDNTVGTTEDCLFLNNTCFENDTLGEGLGELWIQYASNNRIENNIFFGLPNAALTYSESGNVNNSLNYNLWYSPSNPEFVWQSVGYTSFAQFQAGSGQDTQGSFEDPLLIDPGNGDGHISNGSPARDSGNPTSLEAEAGTHDFDGEIRLVDTIDRGMDEIQSLPVCFFDLLPQWLGQASCDQPTFNIQAFIALIQFQCPCP